MTEVSLPPTTTETTYNNNIVLSYWDINNKEHKNLSTHIHIRSIPQIFTSSFYDQKTFSVRENHFFRNKRHK